MAGAVGIDLGSSCVLIIDKKRGIVLREPSVLAVDRENGRILAMGRQAEEMLDRTPGGIAALRPIQGGVIRDVEMCREMLRAYMRRICAHRLTKPALVLAVPACISRLEEGALLDAAKSAGARRVFFVETALAAAIGAGIDFRRPEGRAILDIGGGCSNFAVLSLGGIVESASVKVGGDSFDRALIRYLRKNRDILIGSRIAEELKIKIGCVLPRPEEVKAVVKGRDLKGKHIADCEVSASETIYAFEETAATILDSIHMVLEKTPPELLSDIARSGITLTGGGSLLWGFDEYIRQQTGLRVQIADDCAACVAFGLGKLADSLPGLKPTPQNHPRQSHLLHKT